MKVTLQAIGLALLALTSLGGLSACTSDTVTTASITSTTLAPGQMTFDTLTQGSNDSSAQKIFLGLCPTRL